MKNNNFVTLKEIAKIIGLETSHARKYILSLKCTKPFKVRTLDSKNQLTLAWTKEDAAKIYKSREISGFFKNQKIDNSDCGVFYVIQVIPEFCEGRLKFGFTTNLDGRLISHSCSAPTLKLLATWGCNKNWEITLLDLVSKLANKKLSNEVYEFESIEKVLEKCRNFFSFMNC